MATVKWRSHSVTLQRKRLGSPGGSIDGTSPDGTSGGERRPSFAAQVAEMGKKYNIPGMKKNKHTTSSDHTKKKKDKWLNQSNSGSISPMPGLDDMHRADFFDDGFESGTGSSTSNEPTPPLKKGGAENYVGFANLPNQVFRKSVKKGFQFTLMVVGESGLGKSTLINSLFLTDIYVNSTYEDVIPKFGKVMEVNASTFELKEGGVRLQLAVVDTPGFGDNIDNTDCWNSVIQNIENKFEDYLNMESRVNRVTAIHDTRVHCCLYFIAPSGHGLKHLDIEFMKKLHEKVNIVPVIAKADTLTAEECEKFKKQIMYEIVENNINIYNFPPLGDEESENDLASLRQRIPFAVVGSNTVLEVGGKKVRGRRYPWGIVEVENIEHCDFIALRNLLIRTHMQDLIDVTNDVHYENFRSERLSVLTGGGASITSAAMNVNPMEQIERERDDQEKKLKKMEQEMEQVFEMKVKEKKKKLKDSEAEFSHKYEQTMKTLEQTRGDLEEKRARFEKERSAFEAEYNITSDGINRPGEKKHKDKKKHLF